MNIPLLKWPGSKFQIIKKLQKHIPRTGYMLVEPFAGSCAFSLNSEYENYVLNDANPDLINLYRTIVDNPKLFIEDSTLLFNATSNTEENYYNVRDNKLNLLPFDRKRAVHFHWLLRHGYNGLVRYSKGKKEFNVPYGFYKNPSLFSDRVYFFAEKFQKAKFTCLQFHQLLTQEFEGSVIMNDPPYLPLSKTASFVNYAPCGFTNEDHATLDRLCVQQSERGNKVFVCNHRVPEVDKLYVGANSHVNYFVQRYIAAKSGARKRVKETLLKY